MFSFSAAHSVECLNDGEEGSRATFTSFSDAADVYQPGFYCFSIGETAFSSYIDKDGYLLIAIDYHKLPDPDNAGEYVQNESYSEERYCLPATHNIDTTTWAIFPPAVLRTLQGIETVKISSSDGQVNATTHDASIINNIQNNNPIKRGKSDNKINRYWSGHNAKYIYNETDHDRVQEWNATLAHQIVHNWGVPGDKGMVWVPFDRDVAPGWESGEVQGSTNMSLWVKPKAHIRCKNDVPYKSLGATSAITSPGEYCFDLDGEKFITHVDKDNNILVASDVGKSTLSSSPSRTALAVLSSLSKSKRGILKRSILSKFTKDKLDKVLIYRGSRLEEDPLAQDGHEVVVETTNEDIIGKISLFKSLRNGKQNAQTRNSWSGTGEEFFNGITSKCRALNTALRHTIINSCNKNGLNWIPSNDRVEVADESLDSVESIHLLVKPTPCAFVLGISNKVYTVTEDPLSGFATKTLDVVVTLNNPLDHDITISYKTIDASAVGNSDFKRKDHTITLPSNATSVTIPIEIYNDEDIENEEFFYIEITDVSEQSVCIDALKAKSTIIITSQSTAPLCFEDSFDSGIQSHWEILKTGREELDNDPLPAIVDQSSEHSESVYSKKRLRFTNAEEEKVAGISSKLILSTEQSIIEIEFDYESYGGWYLFGSPSGGSGLGIVLFDANTVTEGEAVLGGHGSSLGYAAAYSRFLFWETKYSGFKNGWLGIGLDTTGDFSKGGGGNDGGIFNARSYHDIISIRGSDTHDRSDEGYGFLASSDRNVHIDPSLAGDGRVWFWNPAKTDYRSGRYKITIDGRTQNTVLLTVTRALPQSAGYGTPAILINKFNLSTGTGTSLSPTPKEIRIAITGSTDYYAKNIHEISHIKVNAKCRQPSLYDPYLGVPRAWDTFRHDISSPPYRQLISTKLVKKPFDLILANVDKDEASYTQAVTHDNVELFVKAGIYDITKGEDNARLISNEVEYSMTDPTPHEKEFTVLSSSRKARVGFMLCATQDENRSKLLYYGAECNDVTIKPCNTYDESTLSTPTWFMCMSKDEFAIRPDRFEISGVPSTIRGGEDNNISYFAYDFLGLPSKDYNASVELNSTLTDSSMVGCANQNINFSSSVSFSDGTHDGSTNQVSFDTVGDFTLILEEKDGSEFALVDKDDTPVDGSEERFITKAETDVHIVPADFNVTATLSNANVANGFTYLHDINNESSMVATLSIDIQAVLADGSSAENYESDCFAKSTTLAFDLIHTYNRVGQVSLSMLYYNILDTNSVTGVNINPNSNNIQTSIMNNKTIFAPSNNGRANISLGLNFDRKTDQTENPFTVAINDLSITDTADSILSTNENILTSNATFYYARVRSSKSFYPKVTAATRETPILIDVFCNLGYDTCADAGIDTVDGETNQARDGWWLSLAHNVATDGTVSLTASSNGAVTPNANITEDAEDPAVLVTLTNVLARPATVNIDLVTGTSSWLNYEPTSTYGVEFISTSAWSGHGETGHVVDSNASKIQNRRLGW
jgi:hypothetical protein